MCGIFGFVSSHQSAVSATAQRQLLEALFVYSESRGKDASGVCTFQGPDLTVLKRPMRATHLIRSSDYATLADRVFAEQQLNGHHRGFLGHARMVTNGSQELHANNQPVIKDDTLCLLNGIVVNDGQLWDEFPQLTREFEVDAEIILALIDYYRHTCDDAFVEAIQKTVRHLKGGNSFAILAHDVGGIVLGTTNGSLYYCPSQSGNELIFASERYILSQSIQHRSVLGLFAADDIQQVKADNALVVAFDTLQREAFSLLAEAETATIPLPNLEQPRPIQDIPDPNAAKQPLKPPFHQLTSTELERNDLFIEQVNQQVAQLRRCSRCLLPETFPFIAFDEQGVCNYCHNHRPLQPKGRDALEALVAPHRRTDGEPDCLAPLSGGRDSSYGIHYLKEELGLNPVAYTYDWGMVTDLARRNISRMCGELNIEHILISANIQQKRENVRKNVLAWLKRPRLGTVPLFMAGDKQFFYYANMLKQQMNLGIVLFHMNPLERTDFKVGFCGIDENHYKEKHYNLSVVNKARLALYYGKEYLLNPSYLNSTLWDTVFAYFSYYLIPKDYETLYDYITWDEDTINTTLRSRYDWEVATDTQSTWRIGDGTASFYNYIYYVMAGFSENDTLRSNQIRAGMIDRDTALALVERENQPRYDGLQWYCNTIGLDLGSVLQTVNQAPKLYRIAGMV